MSKEQDIVEGNKLIAEFMGLNNPPSVYADWIIVNKKRLYYSELKYHSSWDWLMPVVEKIEDLGGYITIQPYYISMSHPGIIKKKLPVTDRVYEGRRFKEDKLITVWKVVIQFIQWYQQNQKPQ